MEQKTKSESGNFFEELIDWLSSLLVTFLIMLLIFTFIMRVVRVNGDSMNMTLFNGDGLIAVRIYGTPDNGDIIVANSESLGEAIVKRVIATEGQTVDIDFETGSVYVDGELLSESYITNPTINDERGHQYPVTVPENCVFVMGDNRQNSLDSRSSRVGFVKESDIIGKAVLRVFPFSSFGGLYD